MSIYLRLFLMWVKVAVTSFGGGYGMMAMIMDEGAKQVGLTAEEFADMTALDLICPGVIAINGATYVGYIKGGIKGSFCATAGVVLPTILISIVMLTVLSKFRQSRVIRGLFRGIKPAAAGLLMYTALTLFSSIFLGSETLSKAQFTTLSLDLGLCIFLLVTAFFLHLRCKVDSVWITFIGAVFGILLLR